MKSLNLRLADAQKWRFTMNLNLNNLNNVGKEIEDKFIKILKRIGASPGDYDPTIITAKDLLNYATKHKNQPIFMDGEFRIVYIKDNSYHTGNTHDKDVLDHPNDCFVSGNKIHLYCCSYLLGMTKKGRYDRYRATPEIENVQIIDLKDKDRKNLKTRLPLCKPCIKLLHTEENKRRGSYDPNWIAEYGDAKELMDRVKERPVAIQMMVEFAKGLKGVIPTTDYPKNWPEMSANFRKKRKYRCESCKVDCSKYPRLVDAHHKNGDKTNCKDENLECLCKYHHAKLHPHYERIIKQQKKDLQILRELWKEQDISIPHDLRG